MRHVMMSWKSWSVLFNILSRFDSHLAVVLQCFSLCSTWVMHTRSFTYVAIVSLHSWALYAFKNNNIRITKAHRSREVDNFAVCLGFHRLRLPLRRTATVSEKFQQGFSIIIWEAVCTRQWSRDAEIKNEAMCVASHYYKYVPTFSNNCAQITTNSIFIWWKSKFHL